TDLSVVPGIRFAAIQIDPSFRVLLFLRRLRPPRATLFPYTTLFRSRGARGCRAHRCGSARTACPPASRPVSVLRPFCRRSSHRRSEEHTSELQSRENLVCRLLLEKKKKLTCSLVNAKIAINHDQFVR